MTGPVPASETEVSDGVLVHRIAAGSTAALSALYDRYGRPAFALAAQITGSAELAEDVVFEVFHQLWRDPARYDPSRGGFPSWLLAAAHHAALDATRQVSAARRCREALAVDAARRAAPSGPAAAAGRPDDAAGGPDGAAGGPGNGAGGPGAAPGRSAGDRTCRALGGLPAAEREALILAYFAGHTQQEIAADTRVPLETVRSRMVCGMRQLRVLLDGAADAPDVPEVKP